MVLWLIIGWTYAFRYVTNADKTQEAKRTRPVTEGGGGDVHLPWRRHWPLKLKWIITIRCSSIDSSDSVYIFYRVKYIPVFIIPRSESGRFIE